eukprot:jgi/Ulvmu1/10874/UM007_0050.1
MGIDEQFEIPCQQAEVVNDFDDLGNSVYDSSLHDVEATQANQEEQVSDLDSSAIEGLLRTRDLTLQRLISPTSVESLKWRLGIHMPMPGLAKRVFLALDMERAGPLPVDSLEHMMNFL